MIRGVFLSLLIHISVIIALVFTFYKPEILATKTKRKVISLSFVKLEKPKPKIVKSEKRKVKSEVKKPKIKPKKVKKLKKIKKIKKRKIHHKKITKKVTHKIYHPKPKTIQPKSSTPNPQPSYKSTYINLNRSKIYEAIQRAKRYPSMAKRLRKEGIVHTCFELFPNKSVKNITTTGASRLLQKGAYQTILDASVEFPNPSQKVRVCLDIAFKLQ